jgi:putative membrane protein
MNNVAQEQKYKKIITALSVIIPLAVAGLFLVNLKKLGFNVEPLSFLPPIYASINGLTAVLLIAALIAIKNGNKKLHEQLNTFAIGCSLVFLLLYIAYHMTSDSTKFAGEGLIKYVYYFILITHIILSIVVIPFVLTTYMKAKLSNFPQHKKIAKITFPLWLYVAITGVIVYLMISPYYV